MAEIRTGFFQECEELLEVLADGLEALREGETNLENFHAVFRAVHSIKGGAAAFGLNDL
ncbi:MAG: Hpt domain-containing protein, partial [Pseudomonadota bacterium]